jgi:hypothetical protein
MKNLICLLSVVFFAISTHFLSAQVREAQIVEKRQDLSAPVIRYADTPHANGRHDHTTDPGIAAMVSAISADTLRATLQEMQHWGSRFLMNDNKKEIALSLVNKFLSYGYTDVKLDSFYLIIQNWSGFSDSSWQYNIVCTLTGSSAPEEIYVIGGHWDSICLPDPVNDAPGVDDNGTAVAATLEIARVMKQFNYHPEATIRFTLFAAEELGLFGSRDAAAKARVAGTDLRYMLNLDMISNNPQDIAEVKIYKYFGFEWAAMAAADATERYTDLSVVFPQNLANSGSDSFPYWLEGFPSTYFEEIVFSPNWHFPSDTLGNCNVPYLKKVTGGALATLAQQQRCPHPQNLSAHSNRLDITLKWKPTKNAVVRGCNIYRSDTSGGTYQKITPNPVADSVYRDMPATLNKQYYYVVTTVNDALQESAYSNEVVGARINFCDSLLVLANVKGTRITPDSIRGFYEAVLDTIPYRWIDVNALQKINLTELSRYRSILWVQNGLDFEPPTSEMAQGVSAFIDNGGNLMYAGFGPARYWINGSIPYPLYIPGEALFGKIFGADSVDRKTQSMLYRANSVAVGYDTLRIDSLKYLDKSFPGQIYNVEVYHNAPPANVIYRFDSKHDPGTSFGKMKNRPVGLEYMGPGHKSILLSFPLYYLDTLDAKNLMHYVVTKKFAYPLGISGKAPLEPFDMHVFPNPARNACKITFNLDRSGCVTLSVVSLTGQQVVMLMDRVLEKGIHSVEVPMGSVAPGFYEIVLEQGGRAAVGKMIRAE